jgi:hypothetical protein
VVFYDDDLDPIRNIKGKIEKHNFNEFRKVLAAAKHQICMLRVVTVTINK